MLSSSFSCWSTVLVNLMFENNNMSRKSSALAAPIFLFEKMNDVCGHTVVTNCKNMEKRINIKKIKINNTNVSWCFLTKNEIHVCKRYRNRPRMLLWHSLFCFFFFFYPLLSLSFFFRKLAKH